MKNREISVEFDSIESGKRRKRRKRTQLFLENKNEKKHRKKRFSLKNRNELKKTSVFSVSYE